MKWDLDFGIKKARSDKAYSEYRKLLYTKYRAEMNIPIQITKLYEEILEWKKAAESYHKAVIASRKWVVSALSDFDMGTGTSSNLLYAIEKYGDNEGNYLESLFNYQVTLAKFDMAIGREDWK
jgi:outer membrane protein TolC